MISLPDMSTTAVTKTTATTESAMSITTSGAESSVTSSSSSSTKAPTPTSSPIDDSETQGSATEEPAPEATGERPKEAQACSSEKDLSVKPFCSPHDQQEVYAEDTYYGMEQTKTCRFSTSPALLSYWTNMRYRL